MINGGVNSEYNCKTDKSDAEIIDFILHVRKTSLKKDLWRHRWKIIKVWFWQKNEILYLSQIYDWCQRVEAIIETIKKDPEHIFK